MENDRFRVVSNGYYKFDRRTKIESLEQYLKDVLSSEMYSLTSDQFKIYVGTDSKFKKKGKNKWTCLYVTSIAFQYGKRGTGIICKHELIEGTGGFSFFDRLWREVVVCTEQAEQIREITGISPEIHFDLNDKEQYQSNKLYASALGYALEKGFVGKCKPDSIVASKVADKVVKLETKRKAKRTHLRKVA